MSKKKLTFAEIFLYVAALILLYMDGMYNWVVVAQNLTFDRSISNVSFIWATVDIMWGGAPPYSFGNIVIIIYAVNILFLLLYFFKKQKFQDNRLFIGLPALAILSYLGVSLYLDGASYQFVYSGITKKGWFDFDILFYIEVAILFFALLLNCYKYFSEIPYTGLEKEKKTVLQSEMTVEELKQYKELLDSGVISQEEFDAKKKQLLGL